MDETKTKEQLEMELWRDGNRQAFLWNLLKNHKIESPNSHQDEITLQDYWRYNVNTKSSRNDQQLIIAGEVEKDLNGNLWHIVHMPPILSNGEKTWKADLKNPKWKLIENLITQRISDTQSKGSDFSITGGDRRAQLQGTILRSAFFRRPGAKVEFHIRADHSVILGPANFSRAIFSSITDFKNAFFIKSANFHHATFKGEIRLNDAQFLDEVNFSKVKLFNHADFQRTKFFKTTYFDEANFLSSANFNNAFFLDFVSFNSAKFNAYATFLNAKFKNSSQFNKVIFSGNFTTFKDTNFYGSTVFSEASFILVADFRDTIFYNSAVFEAVKFNKEA
ncbi:MAG: pentapeptide repeat-containing protein, partial [Bacillota bacterium]|nr:pentapeptide repeat-containing protein [Bacillota bacterium]